MLIYLLYYSHRIWTVQFYILGFFDIFAIKYRISYIIIFIITLWKLEKVSYLYSIKFNIDQIQMYDSNFLSLFFSMWPAKDLQISHDNCVSDHVSSAKNFCLYIDKTHLKDDYYISSCNFYLITTLPSFNALQFLLKLILSSYYFFRKALFYL